MTRGGVSMLDNKELQHIQTLYDEHRFIDAYEASEKYWNRDYQLNDFTVDELILGARLAGRLGNNKIRRWILRELKKMYPLNPQVIYFGEFDSRLDALERLEMPDLESSCDATILSSWYASRAMSWAEVRDWAQADNYIKKAEDLQVDRSWIMTCKAFVHYMKDEWQEAYEILIKEWNELPGMPFCGSLLGNVLSRLDRTEEVVKILIDTARKGQSYEIIRTTIWYALASADRLADNNKYYLDCIEELMRLLPASTPFADRETSITIESMRIDFAFIAKDYKAISEGPEIIKSGFYHNVYKHSIAHSGGAIKTLAIQPVYQKHNSCLTSSLSTVLDYWGQKVSDDELAREISYGGTSSLVAEKWLKKQGYETTHIALNEEIMKRLIDKNIPVIISLYGESISHAVVIYGYNNLTGTTLIHDPSSVRCSHYFTTGLFEQEAPMGPKALIVVPSEEKAIFDELPQVAMDVMNARMSFWEAYMHQGVEGLSQLHGEVFEKYPTHPISRMIQAYFLLQKGSMKEAVEKFRLLVEDYPISKEIRCAYIYALERVSNNTMLLEVLDSLVNHGRLPSIKTEEQWQSLGLSYVCQYADLLNKSAKTRLEAVRKLREILRKTSQSAEVYHSLADIYIEMGDYQSALLPARLAANLLDENNHYARTCANVYRWLNREEEGLEYLKKRALCYSDFKLAWDGWECYIDTLEDYGYPRLAYEKLLDLKETYLDICDFNSYALNFLIRRGEWDEAKKTLERLKNDENRLAYYRAAYFYYRGLGQWREALPFCEKCIQENPNDYSFREKYLELLAYRDGNVKMLEKLASWVKEYPQNIDFHIMNYDIHIEQVGMRDEAIDILRSKLKINADSDWDLRELFHKLADDYDAESEERRQLIFEELSEINDKVKNSSSRCSRSLVLMARFAMLEKRDEDARKYFLRALKIDSEYSYIYRYVWNLSTGDKRQEIREFLLQILFVQGGISPKFYDILELIAEDEGVAVALDEWNALADQRGHDPELSCAKARLLLDFGSGVSDAEKVVEYLIEAQKSYPLHYEIKHLLIRAYGTANKEHERLAALEALHKLYPADINTLLNLADCYMKNDQEKAAACYKKASEIAPLRVNVYIRWAHFCKHFEKMDEGIAVLDKALKFIPRSITLREQLIDDAIENYQESFAIEVAREATVIFTEGAYLWYLYANTLSRTGQSLTLIVDTYKKVLEFNPRLFAAADELSILYVDSSHFSEAENLMREQVKFDPKSSSPQGRLAWIQYKKGDLRLATKTLRSILLNDSRYEWGWRLQFSLLHELKDTKINKEILCDEWKTERMVDMPLLRVRRLEILSDIKGLDGLCEEEWLALIKDFPKDLRVVLRRFDALEEEKPQKAWELLSSVEKNFPNESLILSRKIPHLLKRNELNDALSTCLKIWINPANNDDWAAQHAWDTLSDDQKDQVCDLFQEKFEAGDYLVPSIFYEFLLVRFKALKSKKQLRKLLDGITECLMGVKWCAEQHKENFLRALGNAGHNDLVVQYCEASPELYQKSHLPWQQYTHVKMLTEPEAGHRLLKNWQTERLDLDMFILQNYLSMSLSDEQHFDFKSKNLFKVREHARDALKLLKHDYTCAYISTVYCVSLIKLGYYEEFIKEYEYYDHYINAQGDEYYRTDECSDARKFLNVFHTLLSTEPKDLATENLIDGYRELLEANRPYANKCKKRLMEIFRMKDQKLTWWDFLSKESKSKTVISLVVLGWILFNLWKVL
jgi:predicted Zn-dependent protease